MTEAQFEAAVKFVRDLPKDGPEQLSNEERLQFYALYKQATEGPVTEEQPWVVQVEKRAKWCARKAISDMSKEDAMREYVKLLIEKTAQGGNPWTPPE
ncbi:putative Acyl CoA binding protein [Trypanosoma vivax]|nr:putative Acyl CoA binding protein [Trypanosoma vivax]